MELRAEDLRIGNLVCDEDGEVISIDCIFPNIIYSGKHFSFINSLIPIRLTQEWLLKLGAEITEENELLLPEVDNEQLKLKKDDLGFYYCPERFANKIYFSSVHWLQNWFYFYTGTELKLTNNGSKDSEG